MADVISVQHNIPKSIISEEGIKAAVDAATKKGAERVVKILTKTVSTWEDPPNFYIKKTSNGYEVHYDARTKGGKKFEWVSGGVKPHPEPNTVGKPMVFEWSGERGMYKAKSHVGSLNAYKGPSAKNLKSIGVVRMYQLMHPGIWPRDFAGIIMKDEKDRVLRDIVNLVSKLPKHGMQSPRLER